MSLDAGIKRAVGQFNTFRRASAIVDRPRLRVVHAASPELFLSGA
jgi:hypothetical protein